jgi:DNA-binding NtrC family response regulator
MSPPLLIGKRVLVVDDELLVALLVEDMLAEAGCVVVGPFARVADALAAARVEPIDIALLDVNVSGEKVFPVAHVLEERGIPFLFLTGYGQAALPGDRPDWEACAKPFSSERLAENLARKLTTCLGR